MSAVDPSAPPQRRRKLSDEDDEAGTLAYGVAGAAASSSTSRPLQLEPYRNAFVMLADTDLSAEPDMQYDDSCSACTLCASQFGLLNRRHHCRSCGFIFCGYCSTKSSLILWRGDRQELRVCDVCVLNIRFVTKGAVWK